MPLLYFPSVALWICVLAYKNPEGTPYNWTTFNWDLGDSPWVFVIVSDVIPMGIGFTCTFLALYLNRYVGVLDIKNMSEIYVTKRKGDGTIRDQLTQDMYEATKEDPDRVLYGLTEDNKTRESKRASANRVFEHLDPSDLIEDPMELDVGHDHVEIKNNSDTQARRIRR